jgi:CheY-like chemotaxis protein
VIESEDPHEALLIANDAEFDVLLTDVVMPKMSGRELARELRARDPELRVVYVSGYTADRVLEGGGLEPGEQFLGKPFTEAELSAALAAAFEGSAAPV